MKKIFFFKNFCKTNLEQIVDAKLGGDITSKKQDTKYINSEVGKLIYGKTINECKKLRSLFQKVILRNTAIISQNEDNNLRL